MQSHEVLREVFDKCPPKHIAAEMGLSASMIYKWSESAGEGAGAANPLDRVAALTRITGDTRPVQWVCEQAGGFFIRNSKTTHAHPDFLVPATNAIVQEFADMLAVIAQAASDNHINQKEAKDIRARWEGLKSVTETFVQCCENGNFSPLKQNTAAPALAKK